MIVANNITKSYGDLPVLKGINLQVESETIVCLTGASGAGKSTLLHILGTLDKPDSGQVLIDGKDVFKMSDAHLSKFRNQHIGFVFQFHHLLPEFTALENICLPAMISGKSKKEAEKEAMQLLDIFSLTDRAQHKPLELSGGEQQRIAVARSLINKPSVIFADEPSGNLDAENAKDLHHLFTTLKEQFKQTFVIVTHSQSMVNIADKVLHIQDGIII